jgi:hypothetical protein
MIHKSIIDLLNESAYECGINCIPTTDETIYNWYKSPESYKFKWIDFSPSDRTRLSGIANNIIMEFENYPPPDSFRIDKGTFLKPAKLLQAFFPNINQDKINCISQKLADKLRSRASFDFSKLIVTDKPSIAYSYNGPFNSCMLGLNKCRFELYDNLENCNCLYLLDDNENKCLGRALLWSDVNPNNIKIMDRIYYANNDILALFKAYAVKNGYWYKKEQRLAEFVFVDGRGNDFKTNIWINTPNLIDMGLEEVPYLDTFSKYDKREFVLSNQGRYDTSLDTTNGIDYNSLLCSSKNLCCCCGGPVDEDEVYYNDDGECYCETCFSENFNYCEYCQEYVHINNGRYTTDGFVCDYHLNRHYTRCHYCGEYFCEDENHYRDIATDNIYCEDCADRRLSYCDVCEEYTSNEVRINCDYEEEHICSDCWHECKECGNIGSEYLTDGLCSSCYSDKIEQEGQEKILYRSFNIAA